MDISLQGFPALIAIFIIFAIPIALISIFVSRTQRFVRRQQQLAASTVIAEYEPPDGLAPAEIGYLYDSRLDKTEIIATLLDLEQRGLVRISESPVTGLSIEVVSPPGTSAPLRDYELFMLQALSGNSNLTFFNLQNLVAFAALVKKSLVTGGYVNSRMQAINYLARRTFAAYLIISLALFLLFIVSSDDIAGAIVVYLIFAVVLFPLFLGFGFVAGYIYNKLTGQQSLWSPKAKQLWPQLEGYREYIRRVELDAIQFDSTEQKLATKNKTLPYAVALDLNTEWQQRF